MKLPSSAILGFAILFAFCTAGHADAEDASINLQKVDQLEDTDRPTEALELLSKAEKSTPQNPEVLYRISRVYTELIEKTSSEEKKKELAEKALDYAKRAVERGPGKSQTHLALAIAYGKMTDYTDNRTKIEYSRTIKSEAEKAVQLDPSNDLALLVLARWNFEMARLNPLLKTIAQTLYGQMPAASENKAFDYFRKATGAAPNRALNHIEYARALQQSGKKEDAIAEYRKVIALNPSDAEDRRYQREATKSLQKLQ